MLSHNELYFSFISKPHTLLFEISLKKFMSEKKRKYQDFYIEFGFVALRKDEFEVPQCVICYKTLSNDGMRPSRLKRHLKTTHPKLLNKPKEFFVSKKRSLKKMRLDGGGLFHEQLSKVVEASYEISLLIAKNKKSHSIGEKLIKPSIIIATELILGKNNGKKVADISLSNNTVKSRIDEMALDIKEQVIEKIKKSPYFAIQCDETTDIANCSQLILYARFISEKI